MKIDEIRERYLEFFRQRGHTVYPSDSLVPSNDPSLLFTGAGMNQFKDMFLGRGTLPFRRATTCQKCLRTGDLESVGRTSRHHTFFEMLGNFSFGDYFKREAIAWAWELLHRELEIPSDRLFITVYKDDDEAFRIWNEEIGIPSERIYRLGEADNFWPANAPSQGPNGPCGPCSEIHYDFGPTYGCGSPDCDVTCGCNRWVELWNLVFTQFDRREDGTLAPLPQKNIDTGAGLERWGAVLQGVHSNFETDVFRVIIGAASEILRVTYLPGTEPASRLRRIADHVRALTFCIADNALPGNTGRGYVVRRILRTALRDGVQLGHRQAFLHRLVPAVVETMGKAYPSLAERRPFVEDVIRSEENKFLETLEKGNALIVEAVERLRREGKDTLPADEAWKLYDTYGFPIELTEQILRDHRLTADRVGFERLREAARSKPDMFSGDIFGQGGFAKVKEEKVPPTEFLGYAIPIARLGEPQPATVLRILRLPSRAEYDASRKDLPAFTRLLNASTLAGEAPEGADVAVILDRTPFYAESGGQVGDAGRLEAEGLSVEIEDCKKPDGYHVHLGRVTRGTLRAGRKVAARIDAERRLNVMRNHTGTHILHAALRAVLGPHVQQAGSVVEPDRLRFDFHHYQALTPEEIRKVEDWANAVILADHAVSKAEMPLEEARARGALMFFGEKYGERVRVVTVGPSLSVELCGGTHLEHAGTIGALKIVSESSIGSGLRRIEAVTGPRVLDLLRRDEETLEELAGLLKSPRPDVPRRVRRLLEELQRLKSRAGAGAAAPDEVPTKEVHGEKVAVHQIPDATVEELRRVMDGLIRKKGLAAAILAGGGEKPAFVIGVREDLVKSRGLKAGDLAREVGRAAGGGGGGRELQAQAGAGDPSRVPAGFETFERLVRERLGS
jgi:alanyl-tRNA synthetase